VALRQKNDTGFFKGDLFLFFISEDFFCAREGKHRESQVMILLTRRLLDPRGNNGVTFQVRRASKLAAILWT
jgi:hypothetical protein